MNPTEAVQLLAVKKDWRVIFWIKVRLGTDPSEAVQLAVMKKIHLH
jgi:hypothetical protein